MTASHLHRAAALALPLAWLVVFFLLPLLIVAKISLAPSVLGARPPFRELVAASADGAFAWHGTLASYAALLRDPLYWRAYANSLGFAASTTIACLVLGYPMAYGIARARRGWQLVAFAAVILPFWTGSLLRTYALIGVLKTNGLANQLLLALGVIERPLTLLHTNFAVTVGLVYNYLPFMVLPLAASLMRIDFRLLEAAKDLGARPFAAFARITWPLSMPGVVAGALLVFIPVIGEFVIPDLLGGPDAITIGRVLWTEFFTNRDWPLAAAIAVAMLALIVIPVLAFEFAAARRLDRREAS